MNKGAKYFVQIQKSTTSEGKTFVQGVASGTITDGESERVSPELLQKFVDYINTYGMVLSNGHQYNAAAIDDDLGKIINARLDQDGTNYEMYIVAELDMDNPNSQFLVKKINKGKKVGFSIDGIRAVKKQVFDTETQSYIYEYVDAVPQTIAVTPRPAYEDTFIEVLQKSYKNMQKAKGYTDYPKAAVNNAKKVLEWREKYPEEINGMTSTGWARAKQIANKRGISDEDLGSIASFARHEKNAKVAEKYKNEPWKDAGYVAWLGWGGSPMINWAQTKLDKLEKQSDTDEEEKVEKTRQNNDASGKYNKSNQITMAKAKDAKQDAEKTAEDAQKNKNNEETLAKAAESETVDQAEAEKSGSEAPEETEEAVDSKTEEVESTEDLQKSLAAQSETLQKSVDELAKMFSEYKEEMNEKFESIEKTLNEPVKKKSKLAKSYSEVKQEKTSLRSKLEENFN